MKLTGMISLKDFLLREFDSGTLSKVNEIRIQHDGYDMESIIDNQNKERLYYEKMNGNSPLLIMADCLIKTVFFDGDIMEIMVDG